MWKNDLSCLGAKAQVKSRLGVKFGLDQLLVNVKCGLDWLLVKLLRNAKLIVPFSVDVWSLRCLGFADLLAYCLLDEI